MRLFVAIELPKEVRDYLFKIKDNFHRDLAKVNWVAKSKIHLTLKFLNEVDEKLVPEIINELKKIRFKSFELKLDKLGAFPNDNYARVLWIGVDNFNKVIELHQDIEEKLSKYFKNDDEFSCHITIGRVKFVNNKDKFKETIINTNIKNLKFEVDKFSLIKSELSKDGPAYSIITSFEQ